MDPNKYFSGLPVNTNESSVHVPTNVFDGDPKASTRNSLDLFAGGVQEI